MGEHLSVVMPVYNERYLVVEAIRRVLAVESPLIDRLDLIVVDDGSSDGTRQILRTLHDEDSTAFTYVEHERNQGKGAAVRTGIALATGTVTVIQDADLEYDPQDLAALMVPFAKCDADAVYGSRFLSSDYRAALYFRHALGNRLLTLLSNLISDLNLSDMETCYKAVRTELLKSIPIRSSDFRIEPELTIKLAKRDARIYEVPISYAGRTYREGKKIGVRDGFLALGAMLRWWLIDDIYDPDEYGSSILVDMAGVPNFNRWMADVLRPDVGERVLEVGAGIGNLSREFMPRERYTVSDVNPHYLRSLRRVALSKPYLDVRQVDLSDPRDFEGLDNSYDTAIVLNVLEHIEDESQCVRNIYSVLEPGGVAIVLVPQGPRLYGSLDEALGHVKRYTRDDLRAVLEREGFAIRRMYDFNKATSPGWWLNGTVLRRKYFSRLQLKIVDKTTWLLRRLDRVLPWHGVSIVALAEKPDEGGG